MRSTDWKYCRSNYLSGAAASRMLRAGVLTALHPAGAFCRKYSHGARCGWNRTVTVCVLFPATSAVPGVNLAGNWACFNVF